MLSPRRRVRIASADKAGAWVSSYDETHAVAELDALAPSRPVAMHLAPWQGRVHQGFRFLLFDCDAKAVDAAQAAADAELLESVQHLCGIPAVIACSGPSAGRHVWSAAEELIPVELARRIVEAAAVCCPTLDPAPMTNAYTGCVRPPGAPHRDGGHVHLLDHTVEQAVTVLSEGAPLRAFYELADFLEARAALLSRPGPAADAADDQPAVRTPHRPRSTGALPPSITEQGEPVRGLETDEAGRPKLRATKRAPSENTREALARTLPPDVNHSAHAFAVLLGLILAGWTYVDVDQLVHDPRSSPGLEWFRTTRAAGTLRTVHSPRERDCRLSRQWYLAVHAAARLPRTRLDKDDAAEVTVAVTNLLRRIEAAGADTDRWTRPSGPADRAVLIAVAHQALVTATLTLDLDVRRMSLLINYSHETANVALTRLFRDGWLTEVTPADRLTRRARTLAINADTAHCCTGHRGHVCAVAELDDPYDVSAVHHGSDTSNNAPLLPLREGLISQLSAMLDVLSADVWSAPGVGHHAVWTLLAMGCELTTVASLVTVTRYTERTVRRHCSVLETLGLAERAGEGSEVWRRTTVPVYAAGRGTRGEGRGIERAAKYRIDRAVADWWQAELEWLRLDRPTKRRRGRRVGANQLVLPGASATARAYPRTGDGRPDHARAWTIEALRLRFSTTVLAGIEATAVAERVDLDEIARTGTVRRATSRTGRRRTAA